ncbi:hypothetical protein [Adhaeribacter soli]|uniref:Uncharacterized protein n=1 Tax=Adhaeribacter soli TaxID=2607655 RepID=A0A5N1IP36_9BACT|nr:hypothetical protein [Adhaeribacter soli]KAA9327393.1 hypothetical protein F0P94_15880 [Adhaeribacter soli]
MKSPYRAVEQTTDLIYSDIAVISNNFIRQRLENITHLQDPLLQAIALNDNIPHFTDLPAKAVDL